MASSILLPETAHSLFNTALVSPELAAQEAELFGDSEECTDREAVIIFDSRLTHTEKLAALKVLRLEPFDEYEKRTR